MMYTWIIDIKMRISFEKQITSPGFQGIEEEFTLEVAVL